MYNSHTDTASLSITKTNKARDDKQKIFSSVDKKKGRPNFNSKFGSTHFCLFSSDCSSRWTLTGACVVGELESVHHFIGFGARKKANRNKTNDFLMTLISN